MLEITVDRSTWLRGEGTLKSYLLRSDDGKMCCLGSFCLQMGVSVIDIKGVKSPATILNLEQNVDGSADFYNPIYKYLGYVGGIHDSVGVSELMALNDDRDIPTDLERETLLNKAAAKLKFKFIFVDRVDSTALTVL